MKYAFTLISRQKFLYSAALFLLAGSLKDAVQVCLLLNAHLFKLLVSLKCRVCLDHIGTLKRFTISDGCHSTL